MTGGGRGFCHPAGLGRGFRARSFAGWGRGYGRAYHAGWPVRRGVAPVEPRVSRDEEMDFLKDQARTLREDLQSIEARIEQLGNQS
jgi:hypothetical protein